MSSVACSVVDCETNRYCRGYCRLHYVRWQRHGDPAHVIRQKFVAEECTLPDCDKPHEARGFCTAHYQRWRKYGDVEEVQNRWSGQANSTGVIGYGAAHDRLRAARGRADVHECEHCGIPAKHWAYDHQDPNEISLGGRGAPYSADPRHYIPLCGSCHKIFDFSI